MSVDLTLLSTAILSEVSDCIRIRMKPDPQSSKGSVLREARVVAVQAVF
jgi:hypothetical protein